jgi:hypothetical protein
MKFRGDGCSLVGGGRSGILLKVGEGDKVVSDKLKRREGQRSTRHKEGGVGSPEAWVAAVLRPIMSRGNDF